MSLPTHGANAYPDVYTVGPIGGMTNVREYSEAEVGQLNTYISYTPWYLLHYRDHSHYAEVSTEAQLRSALASAQSGDIIWVLNDITVDESLTVPQGVIIAGDRGLDGAPGPEIFFNNYGSYYVEALFNSNSYCVFSGLRLRGYNGLSSSRGIGACAIRGQNKLHIVVENCDIGHFDLFGVWFGDYGGAMSVSQWQNDSLRHHVRNCYIHNVQQHGFGYGVGVQGSGVSVLVEACVFKACRHPVMGQAGDTSYEVRYSKFYEALYQIPGYGWYYSQQTDVHGAGTNGFGSYSNQYTHIHHCSFYDNPGKPNHCMRGAPQGWARIEFCWTEKTSAAAAWETVGAGEAPATYPNFYVNDNLYGGSEPTGDGGEPGNPDIVLQALSLLDDTVAIGDPYTVTALVRNQGTASGSAQVTIGYINTSGIRVPLKTETVTLAPGVSTSVILSGTAATAGDWTFYCGELTAILHVGTTLRKMSITVEVNRS